MYEPEISFLKADLTQFPVDAIVNAANAALQRGGGVDGAIHNAAGPGLQILCNKVIKDLGRNLIPGEVAITESAGLNCRFVIHAVGPIWTGGNQNEESALSQVYSNSLDIGVEHNINSIAFPNISTGIYGFPKQRAAEIALESILDFTKRSEPGPAKIFFVIFDDENLAIYRQLIRKNEFSQIRETQKY